LIFYYKFYTKNLVSHLSVIQFSSKSITKYLNFSLTICIYWHNSEYTFSTQCLNVKNIASYTNVSRNVNLTSRTFTSSIFMISITRSWTDKAEIAIDCTNRSISACLSMKVSHCKIMLPWLSLITIFTKDIDLTMIPTSRYL